MRINKLWPSGCGSTVLRSTGSSYRSFMAASLTVRILKEGDHGNKAARGRCKGEGRVEWKGKVFVLGPVY